MENNKTWTYFTENKTVKNVKIIEVSHAFKDFAVNYNVAILKSFNPGLKL